MKKNGEYVGIDEKFIPENEKYVDESLLGNKEESKRKIKKVAKTVVIGYLCFIGIVVALMIGMISFGFKMFNKTGKLQEDMLSSARQRQQDMISSAQQSREEMINQYNQDKEEAMNAAQQKQEEILKEQNESKKKAFNQKYEMYSGTSSKLFVTTLLDNVITNNKTNIDKIITVIYNETTTTDPNEIVELKKSFEQGKDYEIMLDYDTNGLVNKVTIKDI